MAMRQLSIREALNEALAEEMERDERVFLMGEEVGYYDGAYKVSRGLLERFGEMRVVDTPIAETGFAGVGVGAAMVGLRPVIEFMTWNFSLCAIDQVVNGAAKVSYMSAGEFDCPIVFRGPGGAVHQLAAQHSQSFESFYAHVPGLKVVAPSNSYDAKGLLKTAIRDEDPTIFIESEAMYGIRSDVPEETYTIPFGKAQIKQEGEDVTILTWAKATPTCVKAGEILKDRGVSAEVIDLRSIRPLDFEAITASVKKTNRVVIVQECWPIASVGTWLSSHIMQELFDYLDAPVLVLSNEDYPFPYAKTLEAEMTPTPEKIVAEVQKVL